MAEIGAADVSKIGEDRSLLLVDDDKPFLTRLTRAMEARGFEVRFADTVQGGLDAVAQSAPAYAVVAVIDGANLTQTIVSATENVAHFLSSLLSRCRAAKKKTGA